MFGPVWIPVFFSRKSVPCGGGGLSPEITSTDAIKKVVRRDRQAMTRHMVAVVKRLPPNWVALVNGNMDQKPRLFGGLILSHAGMMDKMLFSPIRWFIP